MPVFATGAVFLVLSSFLASTVEMVEALTIVLAVGVSRQWRSTLIGVAVALVALAAVVAALGPALALVPIDALRVVVGALLLIFGLQWLRKSILRASGHVALHDEDAIYERELAADGTGSIQLAAAGAAIAVVLVTIVGTIVRQPLSRVPENKMKFVVGAMLTTFGIFWGSEGVGVVWPGQDAAILAILAFVLVTGLISVCILHRS